MMSSGSLVKNVLQG